MNKNYICTVLPLGRSNFAILHPVEEVTIPNFHQDYFVQ